MGKNAKKRHREILASQEHGHRIGFWTVIVAAISIFVYVVTWGIDKYQEAQKRDKVDRILAILEPVPETIDPRNPPDIPLEFDSAQTLADDILDSGELLDASTLLKMGGLSYSRGNYERALGRYNDALDAARSSGDSSLIAGSLMGIGLVRHEMGETEEALALHRQALSLYRKTKYRSGVARALGNMALVYISRADSTTAFALLDSALTIDREIGDCQGEIAHGGNKAKIYHDFGFTEKALYDFRIVLDKCIKCDLLSEEAGIRGNIGLGHYRMDDLDSSLFYHQSALAIHTELGERRGMGADFSNIGLVYLAQDLFDTALSYFRQGLDLAEQIGDRPGIAACLGNIGGVWGAKGIADSALLYCDSAVTLHDDIDDPLGEATDMDCMAQAYLMKGENEQALYYYRAVLEKIDQHSLPYDRRRIVSAIHRIEMSLHSGPKD